MGNPEYSAYTDEDEVFGEELAISARIVLENSLPPDVIRAHKERLQYWGVTLQGLAQIELPNMTRPDNGTARHRDMLA